MKIDHELRIVITPFCNYRCFFCHNEGIVEEDTLLLLTPKDYGYIVNLAKEKWGWDTVTITGGEPLVSPIYREVCEEISKNNIRITTVTNASLISSPSKILANTHQINISIHTMDPEKYKQITGSKYPLENIVNTIMSIRADLPNIDIHLNNTVVHGINDASLDMEKIISFANKVGGVSKFINLASCDESLIVPVDEIEDKLISLGFNKTDETEWQIYYSRGLDNAIITRCGFSQTPNSNSFGYLSLFLNPDGKLMTYRRNDHLLNILNEIKSRDTEGIRKKIEWYFPPSRAIYSSKGA